MGRALRIFPAASPPAPAVHRGQEAVGAAPGAKVMGWRPEPSIAHPAGRGRRGGAADGLTDPPGWRAGAAIHHGGDRLCPARGWWIHP